MKLKVNTIRIINICSFRERVGFNSPCGRSELAVIINHHSSTRQSIDDLNQSKFVSIHF